MTVLPKPVALPLWGLASFKVSRLELRGLLGDPHYVETDPRRTCGGEQDGWAYRLSTGQRLVVILDVTSGWAELCADPPILEPVLETLKLLPGDPRLTPHAEPVVLS